MAKIDWEYCGEPSRIDDDGTPLFNFPPKSGNYLVTLLNGSVDIGCYDADYSTWLDYPNSYVIAWAEKPLPYKMEEEQ